MFKTNKKVVKKHQYLNKEKNTTNKTDSKKTEIDRVNKIKTPNKTKKTYKLTK